MNKGRSPSPSRLPADAACRKNAQSSLRPKPGSSYGVQHLKNTDHINGIGKCYSKIRALASKNQGPKTRKPLPQAAFRLFALAQAPFEPLFPSENDTAIFAKTASRHHDAPLPGQTAASPRIKRGRPSTPARPLPLARAERSPPQDAPQGIRGGSGTRGNPLKRMALPRNPIDAALPHEELPAVSSSALSALSAGLRFPSASHSSHMKRASTGNDDRPQAKRNYGAIQ